MTPGVRDLLEERHILDEDLRQVLWETLENPRGLLSPRGTSLARRSIGNVTFWVEYREEEEGFSICNAWSHRMTLELMS